MIVFALVLGFLLGGSVGMVISHYVYARPWDTGWSEGWHSAKSANLRSWEEGFRAAMDFYKIEQDDIWE